MLDLSLKNPFWLVNRAFRRWTKYDLRAARMDDLSALEEIEAEAFDLPEQRANQKALEQRIRTGADSCILLVHRQLGVVGSMYLAPIVVREFEASPPERHAALSRENDYSVKNESDGYFIVGLQSRRVPGRSVDGVVARLGIALAIFGLARDGRAAFGAPRIPSFHKSNEPLQDYVTGLKDPMLRSFMKDTRPLSWIFRFRVVKGLPDFFPDPESRNCAALISLTNPIYRRSAKGRRFLIVVLSLAFAVASLSFGSLASPAPRTSRSRTRP